MKKIWERLLLKSVQVSPGLSFFDNLHFPANIRLDEDVLKTPWKRFSSSSSHNVFKTSWLRRTCSLYSYIFRRRLQDVLIKTNIFVLVICLQDVFKTFSSRHLEDILQKHLEDIFKTSLRPLQDVVLSRLQDVLQKRLEDIFKKCSRCFGNVFKTSSRRLQRCLQEVFKAYYQVKLFLVIQFQDVFKTPSKDFRDVLLR